MGFSYCQSMWACYKLHWPHLHLCERNDSRSWNPGIPANQSIRGSTSVSAVQVAGETGMEPPGPVVRVCTAACLPVVVVLVTGGELAIVVVSKSVPW